MSEHIQTNKSPSIVLHISTAFILLFVIWGALFPDQLGLSAGKALTWIINTFGWFYMLVASSFVLFGIVIAISPLGKLRLGQENDRPKHSFVSWVGMLFAAGLGAGFVFFGTAEPLLYYLDTPPRVTPETVQAANAGLRYSVFHWGLHAWGAFSVVGLTLAYVQYRKNQPALISSAFQPLLGDRVNGWMGQTIDILAVISTAAGVATTFGISALQMSGGLSYLTPLTNNLTLQLSIIVMITGLFLFSALKGIDKGIKRLTNINLVLAGLLFVFVLLAGPTILLMESIVTVIGGYASNLVAMSLTMTPFTGDEWLGANTIFFWAWHMSWSPFVGLFIARISRGRTIREFISGVLFVPTLLAVLWFSVFGGTALNVEMSGIYPLAQLAAEEVELTLFAMLEQLPLSMISSILAVLVIGIFFVTSADSAAFVLGSMTSRGVLNPRAWLKVVWGILIAGTASVLLVSGGGGLEALQTAALVAALPFAVVLVVMIVSLSFMISKDWSVEKKKNQKRQYQTLKERLREDAYNQIKQELTEEWRQELRKELIALGRGNAEMIQFQTTEDTAIVGKQIRDIGFPLHVNVSAIERNDEIISPSGSTEIKPGDYLHILAEKQQKEALQEILKERRD